MPPEAATQSLKANELHVETLLKQICRFLPRQGPIKDFIALNPLHGFGSVRFDAATEDCAEIYGGRTYLSWSTYQAAAKAGNLAERELERVFKIRQTPREIQDQVRKNLAHPPAESEEEVPKGWASNGLKHHYFRKLGVPMDLLAPPIFFRLLSAYLDQGIALRPFPNNSNLFHGVGGLVKQSLLPLAPLTDKPIRNLFEKSPLEAIEYCLRRIVQNDSLFERYLSETVLSHRGWYSMVQSIELAPNSLRIPKSVSVIEAVALELLIELGWLCRKKGSAFESVPADFSAYGRKNTPPKAPGPLALVHEAYEWTHYSAVFKALESSRSVLAGETKTLIQAFFCIDDRECSMRRHLEEENPRISTFGTPGFFAMDFLFQGLGDFSPVKQCPLPVTPRHLVKEIPQTSGSKTRAKVAHSRHLNLQSNSLFGGWFITQLIGPWSAVKLLGSIAKPTLEQPMLSSLCRIDANTELTLFRKGEEKDAHGYYAGYSIPEMADRVFNVLAKSGLRDGFADLIFIVGHGSSSTNNPHFAAYDCGACSGRAGAPNARSFAMMANSEKVRDALRDRGLNIASSTRFIGAIHDTARDEVAFFDCQNLNASQQALLDEFKKSIQAACQLNAQERCRRFEMVPLGISRDKAHEEVKKRSAALFEPRAEFTHSGNSLAIVGTRKWTSPLFLDRRAFMQSYDSKMDTADGRDLQYLLGALIPVCGGINLQYYFSRVDNATYGAGTKLPHNIVGLLGVSNGVDADLLVGLPIQMVEVHDPIRLLMVIAQEPEVALAAVKREPALYSWVENEWIRYSAVSPSTGETWIYLNGSMSRVDLSLVPPTPSSTSSRDLMKKGGRTKIPPSIIGSVR
jgi:uncharacterized protein